MTLPPLGVCSILPAPDPAEIPGRLGQSGGTLGPEPLSEKLADLCEGAKENEREPFTLCPRVHGARCSVIGGAGVGGAGTRGF